jgi:hypothetical protein
MRTVVDELRDLGKRDGFPAWRMDGYDSARWIVLDCVSLVAHVFDGDSREFYDLELLWGDCPRIDWRKELGLPAEAPRAEESANSGEEGDADIDEDAELDETVEIEIPDESTGSNSVEFIEIDPPSKRRQRGRVLYPTVVEEAEDTTAEERAMGQIDASALVAAEAEIEDEEMPRAKPKRSARAAAKPKAKARKPAKPKPAKKSKPAKPRKAPVSKKKAPKKAPKKAAKKRSR